jgi:hypothetical protein
MISRNRIPYPDLDFYPSRIPDPGIKKAPDPGFATLVGTVLVKDLSKGDLKYMSAKSRQPRDQMSVFSSISQCEGTANSSGALQKIRLSLSRTWEKTE